MQKKYAIQGFEGSFHQEAAIHYFGKNVQVVCCPNFATTFAEGKKKENNGAIIAIENSIAGSILPNYTLLKKSNLFITGEIFLNIKQQLVANKHINLTDIKEVHSHPMALLQCNTYLEKHHFKLVETEDTALSAKYVKQHNCKHIAAVASKLAATLYNLQILVPNIHNEKNNLTRFLIVEPVANVTNATHNKASLYFETNHTLGALAKVLNTIAKYNCNLTKLQSFPIPGSNFEYYFYADVEFENITYLTKLLPLLTTSTKQFNVLGIYQKGKTI
jgi:prephenate dehydratase